jgi:phospholipid/cholesterol/gamma-HCH transport system substrate-binding protein
METRSNQILVGAVMLALVVALVVFLIWLGQLSEGGRKSYDIFFQQSVEGLNKGSQVTYSGVPVGEVEEIELDPRNPEFVRVRIQVRETTPILAGVPGSGNGGGGTTATISGVGFTGVSQIQLDLPRSDIPPGRRAALTCPDANSAQTCPYGVPVIPTRAGGFAAILNSAPELLERITTLTERLAGLFSDRNQQSIAQILDNTEQMTGSLAERGPEIAATLAEARTTMQQASVAIERIGNLAQTTDQTIAREGEALTAELRSTLRSATASLQALESTVSDARPGIQNFSTRTLPQVGVLIRDLQATSESLRTVSERLERRGIQGLLGSERLPDYEPE